VVEELAEVGEAGRQVGVILEVRRILHRFAERDQPIVSGSERRQLREHSREPEGPLGVHV
jgi:hypothetical protein